MQAVTQPDGTTRIVWKEYGTGVQIGSVKKQYAEDPGQGGPCFARATAQHVLGEIGTDEYLDAILLHLKDGGAHHSFDQPPRWEVDPELDLLPMYFTDLLAGAVKARIWSDGFAPLGAQEWNSLRGLVGVAWNTADVAEFDHLASERGLELGTLSAEAGDILIMACYARRHVDLFGHILGQVSVPDRSSFDWFEAAAIQSRYQDHFLMYQHSPLGPGSVEIEARFWTGLLNAGWIHDPVEWGLRGGLEQLAHHQVGYGAWAMDYDSPHLDALHAALGANNLFPGIGSVGDFLKRCPSLARAEQYLTRFPLERVATGAAFYHTHTGHMLVPIIESDQLDEERRVAFVKLLLEGLQGLDLEAPVQRPWAEMRDYGMPAQVGDQFTALHAAAWRGSIEIGRLLVEHGARIATLDRDSGTGAAAIARARGHEAFAEWAEQQAASHAG